jgi:hypothetical protein
MKSIIANLGILGPLISFLFFPLMAQEPIDQKKNEKCAGAQFIIEEQPGAPAHLTITETSCKSPHSREVGLTLKNTGARIINAYEVEYVDTYEHKTSISSQGVRGDEIESGKSVKVLVSGGYKDGLSYGKPVGALRKVTFRIKYIGFKDGRRWVRRNRRA